MDQIKIGKFISNMRKEASLTQRQLADKLNISDKTISKWECGNGLPEISLMQPLCEALGINVNELFTGERLTDAEYKEKAEENIMDLIKEKEESKKKLILSVIIGLICIIAVASLILIVSLISLPTAARIALITLAIIVAIAGIGAACVLDRDAGVFECPKCGAKFTPDMKGYIAGAHTLTKRYLKCPECEKSSYCKHKLSR